MNVRFVPQLAPDATQKRRELEISSQRSHAARFVHQRRRRNRGEAPLKKQEAQSSYSESRSDEVSPNEDDPLASVKENANKSTKLTSYGQPSKSLFQILRKGQSDPFNAQAVHITPHLNQLLAFIRDVYLPGIYITAFMKFQKPVRGAPMLTTIGEGFHVSGGRQAAKVWKSMKEELSDEGRALSWVSSYMPVLAKYSPPDTARTLNLIAIKIRSKSMKILKGRIENLSPDSTPDLTLISPIVSLFRASCKENDIPSAKIHAEVICRLLDRVETVDRDIQVLFITIMNNDTEVAVTHMRHTFFDFEGWVQTQLARFWTETPDRTLPPVSPEYKDLHPSIQLQATQTACIRLRRYLLARQTPIDLDDPKDLDRTDSVLTVFATYSLYDTGVLMNVYMNLVAGKVYQMAEAIRYFEAAVALTTLHILRRGIFEATIYGGDHRISYHVTTIDHLEGTLKNALKVATQAELTQYREALLWVFFYGSRFEWRANKKNHNQVSHPLRTWFTKMFTIQVRLLEVEEWPKARQVLRQFVLYEFLEPDLPSWFERTMEKLEKT